MGERLDFEAELNPEQCLAVTTLEGALLIIAGAGSGKTRVITFRIAHMLERGIPQMAILALTFTNKAAREMALRARELTGKKLPNLTISTFHSFGVQVLRDNIHRLGWRENFSIYDESDRFQLIKETARELGFSADLIDPFEVGKLFSDVKTERRDWAQADQYRALYEEYNHSLKAYNAVDFDDLLVLPIRILREHPDVLASYRLRYRYIMVDEFQDTSLIQYRLLRLLAQENVCVVGDDDQSIYSWRGADYENIRSFERDFPTLKEIKLERNYRSTSTILEAANGVISHNSNRKEKALWSQDSQGRPIDVCYPDDELREADFITSELRKIKIRDSLRLSDFGILIRTNSLSRHIEEALLADNLPYRMSGGTSFFQRKEIKDIISYLRVIANPDDDINLLRIINTPRRGIGRKSLESLGDAAKRDECSMHQAMKNICEGRAEGSERERSDFAEFLALVERHRAEMLGKKAIAQKVRALVDEIDYWGYLIGENPKNEKAARWKFLNVEYFMNSIDTWEKDPDNLDPGLYSYLNRITLITRDDLEDEEDEGKINLMTIHAAKGLEFDVVFIAGCEDGIIPHAKSIEEGEGNIEEERRLFYVAITRAKKKLIISSARSRRRQNQHVESQPSPFLEEIPAHLMQVIEAEEPVKEEEVASAFAKLKARFKLPV